MDGLAYFQVTAILEGGASVMFGLSAADETAAGQIARERLSWFSQDADQLIVTLLSAR